MHKEKSCKFQSFASTGDPKLGPKRLEALQDQIAKTNLDGFLVPRSDSFRGEYVAEKDQRLRWLTGFEGSAGICVLVNKRVGIFVDGRYTIQAKNQTLPPIEIINWPNIKVTDWIMEITNKGKIGFDPWLHSVDEIEQYKKSTENTNIVLQPTENLIDIIWTDQPAPPNAKAFRYEDKFAGATQVNKRKILAKELKENGNSAAVITLPEGIAWLLNIRGGDVEHLPIVHAFAILHSNYKVDLFVDKTKVEDLKKHFGNGIKLYNQNDFLSHLEQLTGSICIDKASLPFAAFEALLSSKATLDPRGDITALPKACKNEIELSRAREAHLIDAVAMCKFLCWLNSQSESKLTEIDLVISLEAFRSQNPEFYDISFETICASGPNAALPHYRVNYDSNRAIEKNEVILIDSGGQYKGGTTDITRTTALGEVSGEIKKAFTLVLKGMISISRLKFPKGMAGCDLDAFARVHLWSEGLDFAHGTGHGVGQFLSVHEGPQRLSRTSKVPFETGMIISNEPGFYKEGHFGIRIENLLAVTKAPKLENSTVDEMFIFETLNFVPIDKNLIDISLMTNEEKDWLNEYHFKCRKKIRENLEENEKIWLDHATKKIE